MSDVKEMTDKIARAEALRLRLMALEAGLMPNVRARLLEFAKRRVRMLRAVGARCCDDDAADFVADAITDTMIGDVTWAEGVPVAVHLHGVIRSRTAAIARSATRAPHDSLDAQDEAETLGVFDGPDVRHAAREALEDVIGWLRAEGADGEVMRIVAAYAKGARTRAEVATAASLSVEAVTAARRRLDRLVAAMPSDLRDEDLSRSGTW